MEWLSNAEPNSIDIILTSPPYNTNKKGGATLGKENVKGWSTVRYDIRLDVMSNEEYSAWIVELFKQFDRVLKPNCVILWNANYGSMNTECMYLTVADIFRNTNFTMADDICWKKSSAIPNNVSATQLTRIWEHVFVFCRREDIIELRRLCCIDDTPKNTESYFIGKTLKWLLRNTSIKKVISYADNTYGHRGVIYQASNFKHLGKTAKGRVIMWQGKRYHDKTIRTKYKGELKPFAKRVKEALEKGEAYYEETKGKEIYLYDLEGRR